MALLNVISGVNDNKLKHCLMYILTAARLLWAQKWKTKEGPTIEELLKKLWDIAELDTLSEVLREQPRDYVKQNWKLIYSWAQKKTGV